MPAHHSQELLFAGSDIHIVGVSMNFASYKYEMYYDNINSYWFIFDCGKAKWTIVFKYWFAATRPTASATPTEVDKRRLDPRIIRR